MIEHNDLIEGLHPDGFTSLLSAAKLYDVSTATLRRRWDNGDFPKPVKLRGCTKNYFRNSDLLEYNADLEQTETA